MLKLKNKPYRKFDDEEVEEVQVNEGLSFAVKSKVSNCFSIPLDEDIKNARYYREVCHCIANSSENDQIEFEINSPGGLVDGLISILTALEKTKATSIAFINGQCHSAASILALNCDLVYVSPYASMLVHFVSYGVIGKASDINSKVKHFQLHTEDLFNSTYKDFLTAEEIQRCIDGYEMWLNAEEIEKRLIKRSEIRQKQLEELKKSTSVAPKKPVKKLKIE
jgi:ATP-dependent protease ClpP protease subunit